MEISWLSLLISILIAAITFTVTFYLKEYFQKKLNYKKFKNKLDDIAGKRAVVLYLIDGMNQPELFEIIDIDKSGVILKNDLHTVYVPVSHIINREIILPCNEYQKAKLEKTKSEMQMMFKEIMPVAFDEMFPPMMKAIKENFIDEILEEEGEVSAVVGIKIQKVLSEEGYEIRKIEK